MRGFSCIISAQRSLPIWQHSISSTIMYTFLQLQGAAMLLSCSAKKVTKEGGIGEALRKRALPYVPHPPHDCPTAENVPIFGSLSKRKITVFELQVFKNRNIFGHRPAMRRGFTKGAHFRSAPLADFFGYFLVQRQESNITALMVCKKV